MQTGLNKKRDISASELMSRKSTACITDMVVSYADTEFGLMESANSTNNTKEVVEGGKKCPEMMNAMYVDMVQSFSGIENASQIYGCLLSRLECDPLQLSKPRGYVKVFKKAEQALKFPESPLFFCFQLFQVLKYIYGK